mmetsp:Transcript_22954/g.38442  ORF Transcript_22954/g.38442 Transcript_22954/m.38442 type:complete len:787 (-) Transcript_22954:152-2512(-)
MALRGRAVFALFLAGLAWVLAEEIPGNVDSRLHAILERHQVGGAPSLFVRKHVRHEDTSLSIDLMHGLMLWEGDHLKGRDHVRHFTRSDDDTPPSSDTTLYIAVDIYVKEGGNATAVQQVIEANGILDSYFDAFMGGQFGALLTVQGIAAIANTPDVYFIKAVLKPQLNRISSEDMKKLRAGKRAETLAKLRRHLLGDNETAVVSDPTDTSAAPPPAVTGTRFLDPAYTIMNVGQAKATCPRLSRPGEGITIGILSDSFNARGGLASDVTGGWLPGTGNPYGFTRNTIVQEDLTSGTDEGRAMAQLVHAIAPYAQLCYATAFTGETNFAVNIRNLWVTTPTARRPACQADIIVDDVIYFGEGFYQDTTVAVAAQEAVNNGIQYYSAALNNNNQVYESTFVTGSLTGVNTDLPTSYLAWQTFNIAGFPSILYPVTLQANTPQLLFLQWQDPWSNPLARFGLFVLFRSSSGRYITFASSAGSSIPLESVSVSSGAAITVYVAVGLISPDVRRLRPTGYQLALYTWNGATFSPNTTPRDTYGHPVAKGAFGVGAYYWGTRTLEPFSAGGPVTVYSFPSPFQAIPDVREKPSFTSVDGTSTSFFGGASSINAGLFDFFGTSAAAPHAAAAGALVLQVNGGRRSLTPAQMATIWSTTSELATYAPDRGYGLINALAASLATGRCTPIDTTAPSSSIATGGPKCGQYYCPQGTNCCGVPGTAFAWAATSITATGCCPSGNECCGSNPQFCVNKLVAKCCGGAIATCQGGNPANAQCCGTRCCLRGCCGSGCC